MKQHLNTYGGLNKDAAYDSIKNTQYINAVDVRITTSDGESQGAITNIQGNELAFSIDQTGAVGVKEIIGVTTIRNKIILFCADDSAVNNGWIYYVEYDETTRNITTGPTPPLIYSGGGGDLNFSKSFPIEGQGRYESDCKQRIYWTDYNNNIRSLLIEDFTALPLTTSISVVDIFPQVQYTEPLLTDTSSGGTLLTGEYQFAYRLTTSDGKQTLISPPGNLIHAVSENENNAYTVDYYGDPKNTNTSKSLEITIDTTNYFNTYDKIELICLFYNSLTGVPDITSVESQTIQGNSTKFRYTGSENTITTITIEDFGLILYPFVKAKTLVPKDNSLVVANVSQNTFRIGDLLSGGETFDASTLRYDAGGAVATGTAQEVKFNLKYNLDKHWIGDWHENRQYKYQSNGTTIGGSGVNVSYKIILEDRKIDSEYTANMARLWQPPTETISLNDGYSYTNKSFNSPASPYVSGLIRGYKRGEVYRFGIIFYNATGEASFVEYIGDIKMPDISDTTDFTTTQNDKDAIPIDLTHFPVSVDGYTGSPVGPSQSTYGCNLGIEFTLNFASCPSLPSIATSYQIVRVKRTSADKRRLSSGVIKAFSLISIGTDDGGDEYDFQVSLDNNVLHMNPAQSHGDAGFWSMLNNDFHVSRVADGFAETWPVWGGHIAFCSPKISYNFNMSEIDAGGEMGVLVTGCYDNYGPYHTTIASNSNYSYDNDISPIYGNEIGYNLNEQLRKVRYTSPVNRYGILGQYDNTPIPQEYRGVEYFKKIYGDLVRSTCEQANEDIPQADREAIIMKSYGPFPNAAGSPPAGNYMRPVYAYCGFNKRLNRADRTGWLGRGGSCLLGNMTKAMVVGPYGEAIDQISTGEDFAVTTTVAPAPIKYSYVFPLNYTGWPAVGGTPITVTGTPVVDLISLKEEIYGGYSDSALENNTFFACSPVIDIATLTPKVFGGDTFINMFTFQQKSMVIDTAPFSDPNNHYRFNDNISCTEIFPVESQINVDLAYGDTSRTGSTDYYVYGGSADIEGYLRQEEGNLSGPGGSPTTARWTTHAYKNAYNTVYSVEDSGRSFFKAPSTSSSCSKYDTRGYLSDVKTNGEYLDSWTIFRINNFYDVESVHGPINKIINWKDKVYFFQDSGVGVYSINPRAVTSTTDGQLTELGSGQGFHHHQYLTTEHGSIHQKGVKATDTSIYYFDATHKKIFAIAKGNKPISEVKGLHSWLSPMNGNILLRKENGGDNPILGTGLHITRDMVNDEVLFSFHNRFTINTLAEFEEGADITYYIGDYVKYNLGAGDVYYIVTTSFIVTAGETIAVMVAKLQANGTLVTDEYLLAELITNKATLVYDEFAKQFSSFYSAVPPIYIENGNILMSSNPGARQNVYTHNKGKYGDFYGIVEEASIRLVINPNADINKILGFLEFSSTVRDQGKVIDRSNTITAFRVQTEYQDTGKVTASAANIKRRFDKWRLKIPRDQLSISKRGRLRSTKFILSLYYDNTANKELILNRVMSHYTIQVY